MWKQVELSGNEDELGQAIEQAKEARVKATIEAAKKPKRKKQNVDMVNSPAHYVVGGVETIDFIEAKGLGYHLGNCIKYISRADYKGDRLEDLKKARWYLQREIERLEKASE